MRGTRGHAIGGVPEAGARRPEAAVAAAVGIVAEVAGSRIACIPNFVAERCIYTITHSQVAMSAAISK